MFMFKYRLTGQTIWMVPGARKPYKTIGFARRAANNWNITMNEEGCPVVTKVYELVSDGRGGLVEGKEV